REDLKNESKYFADDLLGGLECKTDATVNPYMLTFSLYYSAEKLGAKIHTKTKVTRLQKKPGGHFCIETTNGIFTANQVINAAGVWAPVIGEMVNIKIPILPR